MLQYFLTYLQTILPQEEGQDLAEYAILIAVIALAVIVAAIFLGGQISAAFSSIGNALQNPLGGS